MRIVIRALAALLCLATSPVHVPDAPEVYRDADRVTWHVPGGHVMGFRLPRKGVMVSKTINADGR